jgi:hypothetical protein
MCWINPVRLSICLSPIFAIFQQRVFKFLILIEDYFRTNSTASIYDQLPRSSEIDLEKTEKNAPPASRLKFTGEVQPIFPKQLRFDLTVWKTGLWLLIELQPKNMLNKAVHWGINFFLCYFEKQMYMNFQLIRLKFWTLPRALKIAWNKYYHINHIKSFFKSLSERFKKFVHLQI